MSPQYTFRVTGRLTSTPITALGPLQVIAVSTETLLMWRVTDRAELRGLLARLETFDLDLIEMQRLPHRPEQAGGAHTCPYCHRRGAGGTTSGHETESRM